MPTVATGPTRWSGSSACSRPTWPKIRTTPERSSTWPRPTVEMGHDDEAIELYAPPGPARGVGRGGLLLHVPPGRADELGSDWDRGVALLLEAWAYRPSRVEPLYALVRGLRARNQYRLAEMFAARGLQVRMPDDILFVHREPYDWGLVHEWSEAAYWTGNLEGALAGYEYLLTTRSVPPEILEHASESRRAMQGGTRPRGRETMALEPPSLEALWVPKLDRLVEGTTIGELQLSMGPSWSISDPIDCFGRGGSPLTRPRLKPR